MKLAVVLGVDKRVLLRWMKELGLPRDLRFNNRGKYWTPEELQDLREGRRPPGRSPAAVAAQSHRLGLAGRAEGP